MLLIADGSLNTKYSQGTLEALFSPFSLTYANSIKHTYTVLLVPPYSLDLILRPGFRSRWHPANAPLGSGMDMNKTKTVELDITGKCTLARECADQMHLGHLTALLSKFKTSGT